MSEVTLTAALRSNLLSLQNTRSLLDQTEQRLATGKKVNSALDNPSAFFASQSLTNRSSDLSNLLDAQGQAVEALKATDQGITSITSFLQQAQAIAQQALSESNANGGNTPTDVASLVAQYNQVLQQITQLSNDSSYQGTNLLNKSTSSLTVTYNETGTSTQVIQGVNFTAGSTGVQNAGTLAPIIGSVALPGAGFVAPLATVPPVTGTVSIPPTASPASVTGTVGGLTLGTTFAAGAQQIVVNGVSVQVGGQTVNQVINSINAIDPGFVSATLTGGNLQITNGAFGSGGSLNVTDGTGGNSGGLALFGITATPLNGTLGINSDSITINGQPITPDGEDTQAFLSSLLTPAQGPGGFTFGYNGSNQLVITPTVAGQSLVIGGNAGGLADVGLVAGTTPPPNDSFSIKVGAGPVTTIVTGGQTTAQVLAALNGVAGITASENGSNHLVITSTQPNTAVTLANVVGTGLNDVGLPAGTLSPNGGGLGILDASNGVSGTALDWNGASAATDITLALSQVTAALTAVRAQASTFGENLSIIQTRQSFTTNLINTLKAGSDALTLADTNAEGANLLALQTQQQLGISSLSIASQANQAILKLFP